MRALSMLPIIVHTRQRRRLEVSKSISVFNTSNNFSLTPAKIGNIFDSKFDLFGHGIGLAQLAVGVLGLGTLVAGGGLYALKHHQRATSKFFIFNSLLITSENRLSKFDYSVLPRSHMTVGVGKEPIKTLNLRDAFKSVVLIGDNRSGKTIFLANVP